MYIMTKEGKVIYFDVTKFNSDNEMYTTLWKVLYGIDLPTQEVSLLDDIIDYVNGEKSFV